MRHLPAVAVDDVRAASDERSYQTGQPPGLRPDIGVAQSDIGILGAEALQTREDVGAFLGALGGQAGNHHFDRQVGEVPR